MITTIEQSSAMGLFTSPTSFRIASGTDGAASIVSRSVTDMAFGAVQRTITAGHDSHPPLGHLILLVFEAVMEVVCVSLPGYIIARQGMFDTSQQKFVANLNVALFTPCLSMYLISLLWTLLTSNSLHKARITTDGRKAG
jgi:hypothetical protein